MQGLLGMEDSISRAAYNICAHAHFTQQYLAGRLKQAQKRLAPTRECFELAVKPLDLVSGKCIEGCTQRFAGCNYLTHGYPATK